MLINARGGVQKCESCLHTSLKFERGRRKFPLKPPRSKQARGLSVVAKIGVATVIPLV